MAQLRYDLRQQGLLMRFPKPGIMRAYVRQSRHSALEPVIVGSTFCAFHEGEYSKLAASVALLAKNRKIMLLAGKVEDRIWTAEGVKEIINGPSSMQRKAETVAALQNGIMQQLASVLEAPARRLSCILEQNSCENKKPN